MDFSVCAQCGVEIEAKGIHFRSRVFCSDQCCEEYDAELADKDEPVIGELLDDDIGPDDIDDDLGYRDEVEEVDALDDEFDIKIDDF